MSDKLRIGARVRIHGGERIGRIVEEPQVGELIRVRPEGASFVMHKLARNLTVIGEDRPPGLEEWTGALPRYVNVRVQRVEVDEDDQPLTWQWTTQLGGVGELARGWTNDVRVAFEEAANAVLNWAADRRESEEVIR